MFSKTPSRQFLDAAASGDATLISKLIARTKKKDDLGDLGKDSTDQVREISN